MSLTIAKLQRLWKNQPPISEVLSRRCEQIETIVKRWDDYQGLMPDFSPVQTSEAAGYPTNNWNQVKTKFREYYQVHTALHGRESQIDEVSELFHLQLRDARFRVSSNAAGDSDHESATTTPMRSNPESFLVSYNFPFQVIRFYHDCINGAKTTSLSWSKDRRFNLKFLWMLANRKICPPILSLQSFRELVPLFEIVAENVESLTLEEFASMWPKGSEKLCQQITGMEYAQLPDEQKKRLWRLLFLASVQTTSTKNAFDMLQTGNRALILYGPPGTGKTYHAKMITEQMLLLGEAGSDLFKAQQFTALFSSNNPAPKVRHGCWDLIQFHPSYSYQDFMGGIMPILEGGSLSYQLNEGIFMRFCKAAAQHPEKPFVLIIDEINRADLSSVFGELMYALEYRGQPVQVAHFGSFRIPPNVYLIGTMNTADKSLVSFDLALRRRFTFMRLAPDLECLADWGVGQGFSEHEMEEVTKRAKALNHWLTEPSKGLGRSAELAIGQAYFMKVRDFCPTDKDGEGRSLTPFALEQLWDYHLEPLIEEYLGAETENFRKPIQEHRKIFTVDLPNEE